MPSAAACETGVIGSEFVEVVVTLVLVLELFFQFCSVMRHDIIYHEGSGNMFFRKLVDYKTFLFGGKKYWFQIGNKKRR